MLFGLALGSGQGSNNWIVFLRSQFSNVCQWDGSSFSGDIEEPAFYNGTLIYRRGARIFDAVIEASLPLGMEYAANAVLAGSSAGGLATTLHCDRFRNFLPFVARVKCVSGDGYFIHGKDLSNPNIREDYFGDIVTYHENLVGHIETPLFILNSAFDQVQILDGKPAQTTQADAMQQKYKL